MTDLENLNIIGLTGMSGAGKTSAANLFARRGFCVIDCDGEARRVITNPPCVDVLRKAFPELFVCGGFDRITAARVLFSDADKLKRYGNLVYPYIIDSITRMIESCADAGERDFLLDAPTLYQSGADGLCRKILAIIADKNICVRRITERDGISEQDAELRLNSQPGAEFYMDRADFYVTNNGDEESFLKSVEKIITELK